MIHPIIIISNIYIYIYTHILSILIWLHVHIPIIDLMIDCMLQAVTGWLFVVVVVCSSYIISLCICICIRIVYSNSYSFSIVLSSLLSTVIVRLRAWLCIVMLLLWISVLLIIIRNSASSIPITSSVMMICVCMCVYCMCALVVLLTGLVISTMTRLVSDQHDRNSDVPFIERDRIYRSMVMPNPYREFIILYRYYTLPLVLWFTLLILFVIV